MSRFKNNLIKSELCITLFRAISAGYYPSNSSSYFWYSTLGARKGNVFMVTAGEKAPSFTLPDQEGNEVSLKDFRGKKLILYFYPKDNTPGCTIEACSFRDNLGRISGKKANIVGISTDSIISHQKFIKRFDLPFTLLSDESKGVVKLYGVWKDKNMYGIKFKGIERSTFIIDEKGVITRIFRKVKVKGHVDELLEVL